MNHSISKFMNLFLKFETLIRTEYKLKNKDSAFHYFSKLEEYQEYIDKMYIANNLRNFLSHNKYTLDEKKSSIEISHEICEHVEKVIALIENPILVKDRYIEEIYTTTLQEKTEKIIKIMREKNISHIPVLNDKKKLIGVFSENTIFLKLAKDEIIGFDSTSIIEDYLEYIQIYNHSYEYFDFISRETKLSDAKKLFTNSIKGDKRIAMLFVTKNGKENEKILGIITPWDII